MNQDTANSPASGNGRKEPKFLDSQSCKDWLRSIPLTNIQLAHMEIVTQLTLFNRKGGDVPPLQRLKTMELLREPVAFLQEELAKKYQLRPVPFDSADQAAWDSAVELWQSMEMGYRLCLDGCSSGNKEIIDHIALITHRCLRYASLRVMEYYRGFRHVPPELWRNLHGAYLAAEAANITQQPVKDRLNTQTESTTCAAAYLHALLLHLANPYRMTPKQLALVNDMLDRWAGRAQLSSKPHAHKHMAPIGVDLAGDAPPLYQPGEMKEGRFLDTHRLGASLVKRIKMLKDGTPARDIGLGDECTAPACEPLLTSLFQLWCQGRPARSTQRRKAVPKTDITSGFPSMFFYINDRKPLIPPREEHFYGWRELDNLRMFGQTVRHEPTPAKVNPADYSLEIWDIRDESALGFGLERAAGRGSPLLHYQLLAIRPFDSQKFMLGLVRWITFDAKNGLQIGVSMLPGVPQPTTLRIPKPKEHTVDYAPAFVLPEMPALKEPATLVLPLGTYRESASLDIFFDHQSQTVELTELVDRGADFDRACYRVTAIHEESKEPEKPDWAKEIPQ